MRSFWSFLICLAPAALAMLIVLAAGQSANEGALWLVIILIGLGAILSGACIAFLIQRSMAPKNEASGLKVFLGILAFLGTGAIYLSIGFAGCCGLTMG